MIVIQQATGNRRLLITLRLTGCRPGELRNLIWEWVDLENGFWILPEHKTITRQRQPKPRIIPLPEPIWKVCHWLGRRPHLPTDYVFLNMHGQPYSKDSFCRKMSLQELLDECRALDRLRRDNDNLYQRVRALFFLYAIHRFHLPLRQGFKVGGHVPYDGYTNLLRRRFEEAINIFLSDQESFGPNDAVSSALAAAYHGLAFQTLANQVRRSVRSVQGNQWMFRIGHPADHPLRVRPELLQQPATLPLFPILRETTPVRMDLSHSGWSDIFFLGMDYPTGARVINASINLGVRGRDAAPRPPIECSLRVIDQPVLRLVSVDLKSSVDISTIAEVFDFARDYLGLLKAAVIAAGIVPPGMEGCGQSMETLLERLIGPGLGLEIVSQVNDIPKG